MTALLVGDGAGRTLLVRKRGTASYMQPGGKREPGETAAEAGVRELVEELGIATTVSDLTPLGTFRSRAANEAGHDVVADAFAVDVAPHEPTPQAEIDHALWVTPADAADLPLAPLTREHLLPLLTAGPAGEAGNGE
nr:NUDIX domain-containing protein [Herbiconiux sp. L3-i23]